VEVYRHCQKHEQQWFLVSCIPPGETSNELKPKTRFLD